MYYFRTRFLRHHTPWIVGYGFSIYVFVQIDKAMKAGKTASYEATVAEGHTPGAWAACVVLGALGWGAEACTRAAHSGRTAPPTLPLGATPVAVPRPPSCRRPPLTRISRASCAGGL